MGISSLRLLWFSKWSWKSLNLKLFGFILKIENLGFARVLLFSLPLFMCLIVCMCRRD